LADNDADASADVSMADDSIYCNTSGDVIEEDEEDENWDDLKEDDEEVMPANEFKDLRKVKRRTTRKRTASLAIAGM
jgi:hypothetical protein